MDEILSGKEEKKMNLKRQGYFREMPHGEMTDPSIKDSINKMPKDFLDKVINYLTSGIEIIVCAGTVEDVICPEKGIAGIPGVMTDGTWYWPGDLAYYVKNYKIGLSDDFIKTMKNNGWKNSITMEDLDLNEISIDGEFLFR